METNKLYAGRRRKNLITMGLSLAATTFGLGWLVLILGSLLWEGLSGLSPRVFTEMTPPPGSAGGLLNAIMGSLMLTGLAVLIGTPIGILAGTYMAEYGRHSRLTSIVRFINDILLSAPSIVVGLFIYEVMVYPMGHFSGWAGAVALVPYFRPGDPAVAEAIRGLAGRYSSVLLANHGPVVAGDDLEAAVFATDGGAAEADTPNTWIGSVDLMEPASGGIRLATAEAPEIAVFCPSSTAAELGVAPGRSVAFHVPEGEVSVRLAE